MESPVVVDKPPEYHGNAREHERGFPFDEEEGSGAWSELAARHPDIAARLRQRPATWARKRRPSSQDTTDDFGESFSGFDRFPFDDIPPEFREHFPTHWNRRFSARDEPQPPQAAPHSPQHSTAATQTEQGPSHPEPAQQTHLPQYGLRNTVDLGQRSAVDPSLVDADDRNQRSMSAPPDGRTQNQTEPKMSAQNHQEPHPEQPQQQPGNVRHIPIFVEGRDEPVINKSAHFGEPKPAYAPPPQPHPHPHADRDQYFDDGPAFHAPPNFSRAFGTPFNKGFRQGPQPFVQQKVYPQTAFARGASPQRSQSPKPQAHPEEHYVKVPVHHEPKPEPQARPQPKPEPQARPQPKPSQPQQPPHQQVPPKQQTPPPQPKPQPQTSPSANDPITLILSIQTDVLNLMSEVENFTGTKKDKRYLYLDEMLTRNLIKLDNIETEGKENIRQARKEAIKCIQKCIAVLEAKAEKGSSAAAAQDVEMREGETTDQTVVENGVEVEMKEPSKQEEQSEPQVEQQNTQSQEEIKDTKQEDKVEAAETPAPVTAEPQAADTRPEEKAEPNPEGQKDQEVVDKKSSPKKGGKNVKKRDKSKDNKEKDSNKEQAEEKTVDAMQVDDKGDKAAAMEVDGAASQ